MKNSNYENVTKTIKHFRLKIKTKTKSKMPAKINTGLFVFCQEIPTVLFAIVTAEWMHLLNRCCINRNIGDCNCELLLGISLL